MIWDIVLVKLEVLVWYVEEKGRVYTRNRRFG